MQESTRQAKNMSERAQDRHMKDSLRPCYWLPGNSPEDGCRNAVKDCDNMIEALEGFASRAPPRDQATSAA